MDNNRSNTDHPVDTLNRGINRFKNTYGHFIKTPRRIISVGRTAAGILQTAGVANPLSGAIIALIIVILLLSFIIIGLLGGAGGGIGPVNAGTPQDCGSLGGTCSSQANCSDVPNTQPETSVTCSSSTTPTCCVPIQPSDNSLPSCSDVDSRLKSDLNASVVQGTSWYCTGCASGYAKYPDSPDCESKQNMWKLWNHLTLSSSFKQRLTSITYRAEFFYNNAFWPHAFGYTGWTFKTQLLNARRMLNTYYNSAAYWITHETTHMLQGRDRSLENSFDVAYFKSHGDSACYIGNYIKTYGCIGCSGISSTRESMAEATALYVYNRSCRGNVCITNFKTQCPATYSWEHRMLFPDYEYN